MSNTGFVARGGMVGVGRLSVSRGLGLAKGGNAGTITLSIAVMSMAVNHATVVSVDRVEPSVEALFSVKVKAGPVSSDNSDTVEQQAAPLFSIRVGARKKVIP